MKRFFVFLVVLGIALGGFYFWWQQNAARVIAAEVRRQARSFFVNPQDLSVSSDPIKMTGLRQARVPKLVISGNDLQLRGGPEIASAKLVFSDVDLAGPPFHLTNIGAGYYAATVTDDAVTQYLRQRGIRVMSVVKIPLDTLTVKFSRKGGITLRGDVLVPIVNKRIPMVATGSLVPSSQEGMIDLRIKDVTVKGLSVGMKSATEALDALNPMVDVSSWPIMSDIVHVGTEDGRASFRGRVTGIQPSLLP